LYPSGVKPVTVSDPPWIVSPAPVMSVMWASDPIWMDVRSSVVVALSALFQAFVNPVPESEVFTIKVSITDDVAFRTEILASGKTESPKDVRVPTFVDVAFRDPSTLRIEIVDDAVTKMPADVEVGRSAFAKADSHDPGVPTRELEIVMDPAPFWIEIPVPAVSEAATGAAPVAPIRS